MDLFDELLNREKDQETAPGIVTGVVKENWDEEHKNMVKVEYRQGEEGKRLSRWMPVAGIYTGKGFGTYFLPEIGTEVIIAFLMGNVNAPIVIASLWNEQTQALAEWPNEKNTIKEIRTKGGNRIRFSEEEGKENIEISTPGEQKIRIDDENQRISLETKEGKNSIVLDGKSGCISLDGEKKITLSIGGTACITIEKNKMSMTTGQIQAEGQQKLELKGQQTNISGSMVGINGDTKVDVKSSGITQINGSMVKLN